MFDVPKSTFEPEEWLMHPAVIELESMGEGPANFLTLMLCSLIREVLKVNPEYDGDVRHVIFIEEAHNLIGPDSEVRPDTADPKQSATAFIVKMLAEVRALKEGIVIADQLPTKMADEVLKNTGLKIGLRITSADDRSMLCSTMSATPLQMDAMSTFIPGEALIFYEGLRRPFQFRVSEWCGEIEDRALKEELRTPKNDADLREFLSGRESFVDETCRSLGAICGKYYRRYVEIDDRLSASLQEGCDLTDTYRKFREKAHDLISSGDNSPEATEIIRKYNDLDRAYSAMSENPYFFNEERDEIIVLCDMITDLNRFMNGRWKSVIDKDGNRQNVEALGQSMCRTLDSVLKQLDWAYDGRTYLPDISDRIAEVRSIMEAAG